MRGSAAPIHPVPVAGGCRQIHGHKATPESPPPLGPPHLGLGPRPCAQDGHRSPGRRPRRPGSELQGRWKFLWIKPGAEARWAVCVGSARPPHPVPHPLRPPSPPGSHSCILSSARPSTAASPPSRLWPGPGSLHPSPCLEEPGGGGGGDQEGLLPGEPFSNGGHSDLQLLLWEDRTPVHGARQGAWHPDTPRHRPCRGSCSQEGKRSRMRGQASTSLPLGGKPCVPVGPVTGKETEGMWGCRKAL